MKDFLIKILLETKQDLPDFWAAEKPEGDVVDFEDDSGPDDEDENAANGDSGEANGTANADDGW